MREVPQVRTCLGADSNINPWSYHSPAFSRVAFDSWISTGLPHRVDQFSPSESRGFNDPRTLDRSARSDSDRLDGPELKHSTLVGGPGPPLWKIWVRQLGWWQKPNIWENNKCSKPPTRTSFNFLSLSNVFKYMWHQSSQPSERKYTSRSLPGIPAPGDMPVFGW